MNIFVNISHPAHFHFFRYLISGLMERGHNIIIGARDKEMTIELLEASNLNFSVLTRKGKGVLGLLLELVKQQVLISRILKNNKIDIMLQIGGIFNAPVGKLYGVPTIAFYDTENAKLDNFISFNLSKHVCLPDCFMSKTNDSSKNQIRYPGYHELAYLSPRHVSDVKKPEDKFLIRFVGWAAGHDVGERGISIDQKKQIIELLQPHGDIFISSEDALPQDLKPYQCRFHPSEMHDFMKTCKIIIGESATIASEAACMGIPAVYISNTGRGYTTELDKQFGLLKHYTLKEWNDAIATIRDWLNRDLYEEWQKKRAHMLKQRIDVTSWMIDLVENYPASIDDATSRNYAKYYISHELLARS